jgi:energy-coupling factor transporter ATP-binding protein EcfA2
MPDKMNPFPGLRPFEMQEKYLFFGREDQTVELLKRLGQARFMAVVGTSGSGKSSLVRAGLLPELHGGTMTDAGSSWEIAVMRPGGDPLTNLAKALEDSGIYDTDEDGYYRHLRAMLGRSTMGLIEAVTQSALEEQDNLLIVVDQFEEIFRFRSSSGKHAEEAANFISLLLEATKQKEKSIFVTITMRSDFLGDCSQFRGLAEAVNEGEYLIPRLNRNQRRLAIEGPVKVGGKQIEARLVQQLLNDIGDDPDQLPILQHALMRTWEYHEKDGDGGALDLEHYEATGGMKEALSRHADEVYQELKSDEDRIYCQRIFKALTERVSEGRGIRRPMAISELAEVVGADDPKELVPVIEAYRAAGRTFLMPPDSIELGPRS